MYKLIKKLNNMREITAYNCDYCNKIYSIKSQCKAHEKKCYYNPDTKSCASCIFLLSSCAIAVAPLGKLTTNCQEYINEYDYEIEDLSNLISTHREKSRTDPQDHITEYDYKIEDLSDLTSTYTSAQDHNNEYDYDPQHINHILRRELPF
jgi:hypothetical protein